MPQWQFRRMHPGEMNIDPIESEFFSTEALESLADALVREAIQNSLDAHAARYLAGLWPHVAADRSGLVQLRRRVRRSTLSRSRTSARAGSRPGRLSRGDLGDAGGACVWQCYS
ncbi:MAG: hypothetical protein KJ025_05540 [Burkholderiales bacterium]|nr:hypothetical protein [Burkholderiales bacterium]